MFFYFIQVNIESYVLTISLFLYLPDVAVRSAINRNGDKR